MSEPRLEELLKLTTPELERHKLAREVSQLSQAWWKRTSYMASVASIAVAVLGLVTGFATGFFDRERESLRSEIVNLANTRDTLTEANADLSQANADMQERINDVYLQLKFIRAEASYALAHLKGMKQLDDESRREIETALLNVPNAASQAVAEILRKEDATSRIVKITEDGLAEMRERIETVPASDWTRRLRPTIDPRGRLMEDPTNGRYYDLDERRFYSRDELDAASRESADPHPR